MDVENTHERTHDQEFRYLLSELQASQGKVTEGQYELCKQYCRSLLEENVEKIYIVRNEFGLKWALCRQVESFWQVQGFDRDWQPLPSDYLLHHSEVVAELMTRHRSPSIVPSIQSGSGGAASNSSPTNSSRVYVGLKIDLTWFWTACYRDKLSTRFPGCFDNDLEAAVRIAKQRVLLINANKNGLSAELSLELRLPIQIIHLMEHGEDVFYIAVPYTARGNHKHTIIDIAEPELRDTVIELSCARPLVKLFTNGKPVLLILH